MDAAHDGRGEVWVEVPFEPPEVVAGEKEEAVAAMDAAHDGRDEVRGEVPFEPSEVLAGEEAAMDAPHDDRGEVRGEVSFERAKEEAAMDAAHDGRGEVRGEVPSERANGASSRADYALNDSELDVCRPNFGFVDRPPRHNPKRRHPKNQRDKGINALGKDGKDCSPVKIQKQDDFVTELNNHLVTVYQTALKIREMIELCEFYADMSNSKRNAILAKMLKNTHCQEDFGVLDLIDQAQKYDKFFANLAVKLKRLLGRLRTAGYKLRLIIIKNNGRPSNDPMSLDSAR